MKKVVTMLTLGGYNPMYHLSEKSIRRYAKKIGADFIKQDTPSLDVDCEISPKRFKAKAQRLAWIQKFYIFDLLKQYDRVLYLDSDILVTPHAPDIFEKYRDERTIYMSSESKYGSKTDDAFNIFSVLGKVSDWPLDERHNTLKYYNSGAILFSKTSQIDRHVNINEVKSIFNDIELLDQTYINYLIFKHHLIHDDIDDKFNWTALFCDHATRFSAYFIHHNHKGFGKNRIGTFRQDYYQLYKDDPLREKIIEMIRARLFTLKQFKKYMTYRLQRLDPSHWRWLQKFKERHS